MLWDCSCTRQPDGGDAYPRYDAQNNKSTRETNGWSQASPVYLLSDKATIWAYYPYNGAVTDGTKIPVPINVGTSVDYMWGKSTNQVSVLKRRPEYRCSMRFSICYPFESFP